MNSPNENRITIRLKCPNPLFEEWLITWRDKAVAKDSKMQYSFNNALNSLRKYPLSLNSGRECKILKGFGDKLCKMLDDKLDEHKKNNGNVRIQSIETRLPHNESLDKASGKTNNKNKKPKTASKIITSDREEGASTIRYIPQYGSGSYAILVTLYTQSLKPDYAGYLKKAEIIQHGKDLVNASFTKPIPGSGSRYTAWSSMRTLLTKKLISKVSHPPKFALTDDGQILAKKLYENWFQDEDGSSNKTLRDQHDYQKVPINCNNEEDMKTNYVYISKSYDVDIPEEFTNQFLEAPWNPETDTFSESFAKPPGENKSLNNDVDANISSSNNLEEIKRFEKNRYSDEEISIDLHIQKKSKNQKKIPCERFASSPSIGSQKQSVQCDFLFQQKNKKTIQKYASTNTVCPTSNFLQTSTTHSLKKYTSNSSVASTKSTVSIFENFHMAPHSFDIILCVDTKETSGSGNIENDDIIISLEKSGIKYEVKNLKVGDFSWICKDRLSDKELILPYIIERKRMDDFAHSIRDKRYHEQKFRLKKSAIENLTYLVESYGRNQHLGLPLQTLYQAATNTAIQENFFIKFTENINETVEYLVNFSKILIEMFQSKTLASCSKDDIQSLDINSDVISLMTFKEFNESSIKNKRMKVSDLFVKMLVQIKGMSVERALAITQKYPTPLLLKMEYDRNPDIICEKLLATIKYGTYGKSLGAMLSKTVYQAFSKMQY